MPLTRIRVKYTETLSPLDRFFESKAAAEAYIARLKEHGRVESAEIVEETENE